MFIQLNCLDIPSSISVPTFSSNVTLNWKCTLSYMISYYQDTSLHISVFLIQSSIFNVFKNLIIWYHIVPTFYKANFFFFLPLNIVFLWIIHFLDIFSDSFILCPIGGLDYLSISLLMDIQSFQIFLLQMAPKYLDHMNVSFFQAYT